MTRAIGLGLLLLALAGCGGAEPDTPLVRTGEAEKAEGWPTYGGQPDSSKYSSLAQIDRSNVAKLRPAWTYHTGELFDGTKGVDTTISEVTPILANASLYLCTPMGRIVALDPGTGEPRWRFDPKKAPTGTMYGSHNCRGVSYWEAADAAERGRFCGKRVFEGVGDGRLVAVDADSGRPCADFAGTGQIDLNKLDYKGEGSLMLSSPPGIWRDVVIVGGAVIDNKYKDSLDGIVRGFDARTGRELWSWNPIPAHLSDRVGGANAWAPLSVDMERGWVFLPTGSPSYDVLGVNRHDPIPYGDAVVALDAATGKPVWSYQTVHHDLWDYDLASAPTLATIEQGGRRVEAVIQAAKTGFVFVLDRATGKPLFPVDEKPVPKSDVPGEIASPTQPVPRLPAPVSSQRIKADDAWGAMIVDQRECRARLEGLRNEGLFTPPSVKGSVLHPSFLGGVNWGGLAYDAATGIAVVNSSNLVASVTLMPREQYDPAKHKRPGVSVYEMRDSPYVLLREALLSSLGAPCNPPPWGQLTAIDMKTGKTRWQIPFGRVSFGAGFDSLASWGAPNAGGPIVTAGGLVFIGASLDSRFRAYDLANGRELWSAPVPAPATATPMTYAHGGRQFVVVAAGGHGGFKTKLSDAIVAFALPERTK